MGTGASRPTNSVSAKEDQQSSNSVKVTDVTESDDVKACAVDSPVIKPSGRSNASDTKQQPLDLKSRLELCQSSLTEAEERASAAETELKQLELQTGELESGRLDLLDQVQALEEQLGRLHADSLAQHGETSTETVRLKDLSIAKLEQEARAAQEQTDKLKLKFKKKLRAANKQVAEAKQEHSLRHHDMQQEINQLKEENNKLMDQIKMQRLGGTPDLSNHTSETSDDGRTKIILELSSKLSEQDMQILDLEQQIRTKDRLIKDLTLGTTFGDRTGSGKSQQMGSGTGERMGTSGVGERTGSGKYKSVSQRCESQQNAELSDNDAWTPRRSKSEATAEDFKLPKLNSNIQNDSSGACISDAWNGSEPPLNNPKIVDSEKSNVNAYKSSTWAGQDSNHEISELQQIAREMKMLKKSKKKKSKVKDNTSDVRQSSGISRDSGVSSASPKHQAFQNRISSAGSTLSTLSEDDSLEDNQTALGKNDRTGSAKSGVSNISGLSLDDDLSDWDDNDTEVSSHTPVKHGSIRRISAAKDRKKSNIKSVQNQLDSLLYDGDNLNDSETYSPKPPPYRKPTKNAQKIERVNVGAMKDADHDSFQNTFLTELST